MSWAGFKLRRKPKKWPFWVLVRPSTVKVKGVL